MKQTSFLNWIRRAKHRRIARIVPLLAVLALLAQGAFSAAPVFAYSNHYVIRNYDVDIQVNENNSFDITETIDVWFDEGAGKHGIIRSIPLHNTIRREDGSTGRNHVTVTGLSVDGHNWTTEKSSGDLNVRIGSAYETVEGDVQYVIRYNYDIGSDPLRDRDEFYYDIIGTSWDTDIEHVDFRVTFPEEFDASSLGFATGREGSTSYEGVLYRIDGNTVEGYYEEVLEPYNGLTMRLELPEGYFVREPELLQRLSMPLMAVPILGALLVFLLYRRHGSNPKPPEPVEFYPPDGLNPLDIGYLYDGSLDSKDITSLLVHLANQGYLSIQDLGDDGFEIRLLRDRYEGDNPQEALFYAGLQEHSTGGVATDSDLEDSFYKTLRKISGSYLTRSQKRRVFLPVLLYRTIALILGILMMYVTVTVFLYAALPDTRSALIGGLIGVGVLLFYSIFIAVGLLTFRNRKGVGIIILFFVGIHAVSTVGGFAAAYLGASGTIGNPMLLPGIVGLVLSIAAIVLAIRMQKRTEYGLAMLGRIRGFRNFLLAAEKPKLEALVMDDPSYFYNILPYTYVLGVSDRWIRKFDEIAIEAPEWYSGTSTMDIHSINESIGHSLSSIGSSMISSPSSDYSSSGSSGGGSSGGGSGGGGGSSW